MKVKSDIKITILISTKNSILKHLHAKYSIYNGITTKHPHISKKNLQHQNIKCFVIEIVKF